MTEAVALAELVRGDIVESVHYGHVVVADAGGVVAAWGDPDRVIYPRSSVKMLQALPLVESGAADAAGLGDAELALACASHQGAAMHVEPVARWLAGIGRGEADLRCGPQVPGDGPERRRLREAGSAPCQLHNNCSGKHAGFLTLAKRLGGGPEYIEVDHPVQRAVREAFEATTGAASPGWGIDGCSAPTFAVTLAGLARAMARMAAPGEDVRGRASRRLVAAILRHPLLVAGEGRACSELMAAMDGVVIKTGAEGVFVAILPARGLGVALKAGDGATRASECAVTAILARLGAIDPRHPAAARRLRPPELNRRGVVVGALRPSETLWAGGRAIR
jgi:L-asparaginase II